jgi:hypothetical protein
MQIPRMLYGNSGEVRSACQKAVTSMRQGAKWHDALRASDCLDTVKHPGLLILNGPSPLLKDGANFHCYVPWFLLKNAIGEQRIDVAVESEVFAASLKSEWGTLGLIATINVAWVRPAERYRPFLNSVIRCWEALEVNGERYTLGSTEGRRLWETPTNIQYVLANMGIDVPSLRAPLPEGGLTALVRRSEGWDGMPVVDRPHV